MKARAVSHPWIDEEFFQRGSFLVTDQGHSVILLKGGSLSNKKNDSTENQISIFCKHFYRDEFLYHQTTKYLKITLLELRTYLEESNPLPAVIGVENFDDTFSLDFCELKKIIPQEIKKAVLVSREDYRTDDPYLLRKHLFASAITMSKGRAYGLWNEAFGIIGCTPEILFEMEGPTLVTEALAGTAKSGEESELLNSLKDRNEHNLVIQDLSEKLFSLGLNAIIGPTVTSQFSTIIHLRTKLKAEVSKKISAIDVSKTLSPTAALGGYPRERSHKFLLNTVYQKKFPERFFGSVIGTDFESPMGLVMIRNVQWEKDHFFIESGVGIVEDSQLVKEQEEIRLKRKVVKDHYL
jgi:isochorismate synthase EntC